MNTILLCSLAITSLLQTSPEKGSGLSIQLNDGKIISPVVVTPEKASSSFVKGNSKAVRPEDRSDKTVRNFRLQSDTAYGLEYSISEISCTCGSGVSYSRLLLSMTNTTKDPIGIKQIDFLKNKDFPPSFTIIGETDGTVGTFQEGDGLSFLGIEHPMAKLRVTNSADPKWTPAIFKKKVWDIPLEAKGGDITLTFRYTDGPHRIDIVKAEVLGTNIQDEHPGYCGIFRSANVYTLKNVPAGKVTVRATLNYKNNQYDSWGTVAVTGIKMDKPKQVSTWLPIADEIPAGKTWTYSIVLGKIKDPKQLRRGFLTYLENERACVYRPFPHYNSWYDLGLNRYEAPWNKKMNEAECLDTVRSISGELAKRGERFNSFLWDDGWDYWDSFWDFHPGFPNGFKKIAAEAKKHGSSISAWLSPLGGYGNGWVRRVAYARKNGIISPTDNYLRLSKPVYYKAFRDRCLDMIKEYGMDLFKFDRMGAGGDCNGVGSEYAKEIRAVFTLIEELRAVKPEIFVNATVGTWASPFWLRWTDSIWRGGADWDATGPGNQRERSITYRDNIAHDRIVLGNPLFPVTGLMLGGVAISQYGPAGSADRSFTEASTRSVNNEIWMQTASGIGLQEYYISDHLMCPAWWDTIAKAIHWSRENQNVLRDSHWIGGDPLDAGVAHVYGYASLGTNKGIICLRNPSDKPQTFEVIPDVLLEMPSDQTARKIKTQKIVYESLGKTMPKFTSTSTSQKIVLDPFELLVCEFEF